MLTLYSLKGCPMCDHVDTVLKEKNVPFILSMDKKVMSQKGITHCPALETDSGNILSGKTLIKYINTL